ncbi:MAG: arginine--tRNA ligase, partial [Puniceicoccales bacterium]|nr:arginine--tRNA ligase [Puniceicoccales bacterium]
MGAVPLDFQSYFEEKAMDIAVGRCGFDGNFRPFVRPAEAKFGDFQINGVLPFAKAIGANPRALAQKLRDALVDDGEFSARAGAEVAGAGFINLTLSSSALGQWLDIHAVADAFRRGISAATGLAGRRVIVDYSCPNSAKRMHVGHLRSMVIGDAIRRMVEFSGAKVLGDNHIGDWGTQFGILLRQIAVENVDLFSAEGDDVLDLLEGLYRRGTAAVGSSAEALDVARRELVALQNGDAVRVALWERINELSYASFQRIYDLCAVHFDLILGESFYRDKVQRVYDELLDCGVAVEDNGALVVFHEEHDRFCEQPFIVRKSDGASNYAATDLAAVLYRVEEFGAEEIIYVTDGRQRDHFEQLFLTVDKWFKAKGYKLPTLRHVWFGTVCGADGRAIKTRSGESMRLGDLFCEAIGRAGQVVDERSQSLPVDERERIAKAVAVGAIKYGDLVQNRTSDYIFSLEKSLSFDGNTAPYVQYACARISAILRRADGEGLRPGRLSGPASAEERALA